MWGMTFEKSLRMFDPAYRKAPADGIDRTCPKCGTPLAHMHWDSVLDLIECHCVGGCDFRWRTKPLDARDRGGDPHG